MKVLGPLKVTNERMDEVANYYRFRPQNGELWPTKPAKAYAVVEDGKIKKIVITDPGFGYSSPPKVSVKGFEKVHLEAKLKFDTDLKKNGGVSAVEVLAVASKEPSADEIRGLIDQLVSANPRAITAKEDPRVEPDFQLPPGYDHEKQRRVYQARAKLKSLGPVAFPFLIDRWNDERYCMTMSVGLNGYCFNASVGKVCKDIVYDQLQPYGFWPVVDDGEPRGKPKRPGYPSKYLGSTDDAKTWCVKHKNKSLFEMQLMVIDWVIAQEGGHPADYTGGEKAHLNELREQLVTTQKPLDRGSYEANDIES
jgi:hypothetical protein